MAGDTTRADAEPSEMLRVLLTPNGVLRGSCTLIQTNARQRRIPGGAPLQVGLRIFGTPICVGWALTICIHAEFPGSSAVCETQGRLQGLRGRWACAAPEAVRALRSAARPHGCHIGRAGSEHSRGGPVHPELRMGEKASVNQFCAL